LLIRVVRAGLANPAGIVIPNASALSPGMMALERSLGKSGQL